MAAGPNTTGQRSSNAFARERDALILRLLLHHPATAEMLTGLGLFPSPKKARKRLARLSQRKLVRRLGTVSLKDGRPEHVFGRGRCKTDNLLHEVQLTRLLLRINADEVRRGAGQVDPSLLPDAELWIAGQRYCLELDRGTMSLPEVVRKRFTKYRSVADFVLWICPSVSRVEALRGQAGVLRETALFTTLDLALGDPHAPIWIDADGERAALPLGRTGEVKPGKATGAYGGAKGGTYAPPAGGPPTTPIQKALGQAAAPRAERASPLGAASDG